MNYRGGMESAGALSRGNDLRIHACKVESAPVAAVLHFHAFVDDHGQARSQGALGGGEISEAQLHPDRGGIDSPAIWMQLRIINLPAAERALAAGLTVVVDKCVKMEHGRYRGGLHFAGMNTEIISARKRAR